MMKIYCTEEDVLGVLKTVEQNGISIKDACETKGIPEPVFYDGVKNLADWMRQIITDSKPPRSSF